MIPFDFEYYKPASVQEAVDAFSELEAAGKTPVYYGGGSELISMARVGNVAFGAVIDIKGIPECNGPRFDQNNLLLGSALTLSDIVESGFFPLMGKIAGRIADHTMQCKITLGGNLAGTIIYRETVLPLLLTDSHIVLAGKNGLRTCPVGQIFSERLLLPKGEFVVEAVVDQTYLQLPYFHIKKTKNEKIDYPLITMAGLKKDGHIRIAFSGLKNYPFRDSTVEGILNDGNLNFSERADKITEMLSGAILDNLAGSAEYRKFVLKNTLVNVLEMMENS